MLRVYFLIFLGLVGPIFGCQKEPSSLEPVAAPTAKAAKPKVAKLLVVVVNDRRLSAGLKLLRGEWAERSGGQLEVTDWTLEQLIIATELPADLVLYPSRHVGTLVDRGWLRPVRNSVLQSDGLARDTLFPLVRNVMLRFDSQVYALTLGEPPLMLAGLEGGKFPLSWEDAEFRLSSSNSPLKQPLAIEFLARGVANTMSSNRTALWFDLDSMRPQISSAPFVRALKQMLESKVLPSSHADATLRLSWPTARKDVANQDESEKLTAFAPLPRALQVYDPLREAWVENESSEPLVMLGFGGCSLSVTRGTRNSASAFKLLNWLVDENVATQLSPRSTATAWFRESQTSLAQKWLVGSGASRGTAAIVAKQLSSEDCYQLPRMPGIDEYLESLEVVIRKAIGSGSSAEETLTHATKGWEAITDRLGRERQRTAYRKHLGLDDFSE